MIDAKRLDDKGNVSTVQIPAMPSDVDIIKALDGDVAEDDVHLYGSIRGWDVFYRSGSMDKLVVGASAPIRGPTQPRAPCHLGEGQVRELVAFFDRGWTSLGF